MRSRSSWSARFAAGALLLVAAHPALADRIWFAAARSDEACPAPGPPFGVVVLSAASRTPADNCLTRVTLNDLSDRTLDEADHELSRLGNSAAVDFDLNATSCVPPAMTPEQRTQRISYAFKRLSSAARGSAADRTVLVSLHSTGEAGHASIEEVARLILDPELEPYVDRLALPLDFVGQLDPTLFARPWARVASSTPGGAAGAVLDGLDKLPDANPIVVDGSISESEWAALRRLQAYFTTDVSRDPTATEATRADGPSFRLPRFFDGKKFTPILLLRESPGQVRVALSGGPFATASVENLTTGAKRDFDLRGGQTLALDSSKGPLAIVLKPVERPGGENRAAVEVGAVRGLTAEEIVARERAWDAGQRERLQSFTAHMKTSLRFRIAEVNETFDLTIEGPFFMRRGEPADWKWEQFYLNGVRWKQRTLPKLPILQPEKVTTLPLEIRLSEDYDYTLHGESTVSGRHAFHITFTPKSTTGDKPIYRGSVWIDKEDFSLLRRDSVQLNLKGETLSNVQTEIYRPAPGHPEIFLPLEIKGEQVFSTAGRTTAIERDAVMTAVEVNPPDFSARREQAYASDAQMIRDTEKGMRYLIPDPAHPGQRLVEEKVSRKSLFGLLGTFYDKSLSYPIPLLGAQYFDFDLWDKGKQLSVFFGGALLTANYTDPSLAGGRFDLGVDLFAVAIPFGDTSFRNGQEIVPEKVKHLPAVLQANLGHPFGPYLKGTVSLFSKWDNYQRDSDTGPTFVVPVDTFTNGVELKLVANISGFSATLTGASLWRAKWEPWGEPGNPDYSPDKKHYSTWSASLSKDQYFSGFRKLHVGFSYISGNDLDRFSKYEFGTFSGHPLRGYQSGSLRTETAFVMNLSYGLNIENIIRFEGFYDQAILRDSFSGFDNTYFSGAGLLASFNGPWKSSLIRAEIGTPVVSHGIHGVVVNVLLLKLF